MAGFLKNHGHIAWSDKKPIHFKWGIIPKINPDIDAERELLYQDLNRAGKIESHLKIQLVQSMMGKNFIGDQFFTDGKAYIISLKDL